MRNTPKISVILPVYNSQNYIALAIESILNQGFKDFELLVMDDASTDATVEKIKEVRDPRIQLIEKPQNTGYTNSLNAGLKIAKGKYIARMDADDVAMPERLERQWQFMETHPEVVACGTAYRLLGTQKTFWMPSSHEDIRIQLLEQTCFAHPTVLLRAETLREHHLNYDVNKEPAEDYDLWVKLSRIGKLANLDDVLLEYRLHAEQVSNTRRQRQLESKWDTRMLILSELLPDLRERFGVLLKAVFQEQRLSYEDAMTFCKLLDQLKKINLQKQLFNPSGFANYLNKLEAQQLKLWVNFPKRFTPKHLWRYWKVYFSRGFKLPWRTAFIIMIKSFLWYRQPMKPNQSQ